jgi:hypothetical protein
MCSSLRRLLSGIFAAVAHQIGTVPVILKAEEYEKAAEHPAGTEAHDHTAVAWEPENGAERTVYTLLADILAGIGFALLLASGLTLRGGEVTWRQGLFWGWPDLRRLPSHRALDYRGRCPEPKPPRYSIVNSGGSRPPFRPDAVWRCSHSPGERRGRFSPPS